MSPTSDDRSARDEVVSFLRSHLVGPRGGDDEELLDRPKERYAMGTLFPRSSDTSVALSEEPQGEVKGGDEDDPSPDDPVESFNSWMPSSCGLSFFLAEASDVVCSVSGGRYERSSGGAGVRKGWRRIPFPEEDVELSAADPEAEVFGGAGRLRSHWRPLGDGHLVTVTLINAVELSGEADPRTEDCLFQVGLRCRSAGGRIAEYPRVDHLTRDPEEEELRLVFRQNAVFAVGHNVSVDWERPTPAGGPDHVRTEFMPVVEVPPVSPEARAPHDVLGLAYLADPTLDASDLRSGLSAFVDDYEAWSEDQEASDVPLHLGEARERIVARQRRALARMRQGVSELEDPQVLVAFRLAQSAMLRQMRHGSADLAGASRPRNSTTPPTIDYASLEEYRWRPFQLAYQLLVIPSLARSASPDREVVDLLWFPTGGGKTEAYLTLSAFAIFLRRLRLKDSGVGTTVLTRYTLRLLTTQQFQRTAALICACESIRDEEKLSLGSAPITLGLWIGEGGGTPNSLAEARERAAQIRASLEPRSVYCFQLERCPWCGTEIVPPEKEDDADAYGFRVTNEKASLFCPTTDCRFHEELPVVVIDEDLYNRPPTFVLSTVDKFARLARVEKAGALLGSGGNEPPSLVIQDELHLLSGPLGTTVGIYESAIETVMTAHGPSPKVIASTATIRRAGEQVGGLYSREVELFPPSGADSDDSFFARVDRDATGRLYVGAMTPAHTTAMAVRLAAGPLLAAPVELDLGPVVRDGYWTVVLYHNSLRELGRTMTIARDDIPSHLELIAADPKVVRHVEDQDVVELTGNVGGVELPAILERMSAGPGSGREISVLACTNMLSVGVDVQRLGVMIVNGQPKTASEYIQATSRVGRGRVPGLVLALLSATKPRDRSHYEGFVAFHTALYRHVEPTSVTPYSLASRRRALHAALVIAVRHGAGLRGNADAARFDPSDPAVASVIESLRRRTTRADPSEAAAVSAQLDRLVSHWAERVEEGKSRGGLRYDSGKEFARLLVEFQSGGEGWETLNSMRNVELQVGVRV